MNIKPDRKTKYIVSLLAFFLLSMPLLLDALKVKESEASVLGLPEPNQILNLSPEYRAPVLRGLKLDPNNPLKFNFILELNDNPKFNESDAQHLMRCFLSALATPKSDLWVNLSPYEEDRIIDAKLERTELSSVLLKQDYILKQVASSLTLPDTKIGESYWKQADQTQTGKIWISPDSAEVVEQNGLVLISDSSLKVQSEKDYIEQVESQSVEQLYINEISKQVNDGRHFAELRQVYNVLILASWFKQKYQNSFYQHYLNSNKIDNLKIEDPKLKDKVWSLYCKSFDKGVYSLQKKHGDKKNNKIKKKYLSGGFSNAKLKLSSGVMSIDTVIGKLHRDLKLISVELNPITQMRHIKHYAELDILLRAHSVINNVFSLNDFVTDLMGQDEKGLSARQLWSGIRELNKKIHKANKKRDGIRWPALGLSRDIQIYNAIKNRYISVSKEDDYEMVDYLLDGEKVISYLVYSVPDKYDNVMQGMLMLETLAVDPEYQNKQVAKKILSKFIQHALDTDRDGFCVIADVKDKKLKRFYEESLPSYFSDTLSLQVQHYTKSDDMMFHYVFKDSAKRQSSALELFSPEGIGLVAVAGYFIANWIIKSRKKAKEKQEREDAERVLADLFDSRVEWKLRYDSKVHDIIDKMMLSSDEAKQLFSLITGELIIPLKLGADGRDLAPVLLKKAMGGYPLFELFLTNYLDKRSKSAYLRKDMELYNLRSLLHDWGMVIEGLEEFIDSEIDDYLDDYYGEDNFDKTFNKIFAAFEDQDINTLFSLNNTKDIDNVEAAENAGEIISEAFISTRARENRTVIRMKKLGQRAADKLLSILKTKDPRSVSFKKAAYLLCELDNMFAFAKLKKIYEATKDPLKQVWLCSIARNLLISNLEISRKGKNNNISHSTFTNRLEKRNKIVKALLPRLSKRPVVYDLAVSNGSTSHMLLRELNAKGLKLKAVDLETEFYQVILSDMTVLFNYQGELIQLEHNNNIYGRNSESLSRFGTEMQKQLKKARDKFERKEYREISTIDFRAQEYSKQNPEKLEFSQLDIFDERFSMPDAELVLVSNLFIPGTYFTNEQIIEKVHDLWDKVQDGTFLYMSYFNSTLNDSRILLQKSENEGIWKQIEFSSLSKNLSDSLDGPKFLGNHQEKMLNVVQKQSSSVGFLQKNKKFGGVDFTDVMDVDLASVALGELDLELDDSFVGFEIISLDSRKINKQFVMEMAL